MTDKQITWTPAPDWIDAEIVDDFGIYEITDEGVLFIGHNGDGKECGSIDAAKTAAQVDWDNRIAALKAGAK